MEHSDQDPFRRATIPFFSPLGRTELEELIAELSRGLNSRIVYSVEKGKEQMPDSTKPTTLGLRLSGQVIPCAEILKKGGSLAPFHMYSCDRTEDRTKLDGIRFQTIPGYSLREHPEGDVFIWDTTRKIVKEYSERTRA